MPQGAVDSSAREALPGKQPLIKRSVRPPNYESPVEFFDDAITPNDRFFVRWHLSDIPRIDAVRGGCAWAEMPSSGNSNWGWRS